MCVELCVSEWHPPPTTPHTDASKIPICEVICNTGLPKYNTNSRFLPCGFRLGGAEDVSFYLECLSVSSASLGILKPLIMPRLKLIFLKYREKESVCVGGEPNSRQGHVPVEITNNATANLPPNPTKFWPPSHGLYGSGGRGQEAQLVPVVSLALGSSELLDYLPISTNCAGRH